MHHYRQSIALFGLVVPIVIAGIFTIGALAVKSSITKSFDEKFNHFRSLEQNRLQALQIESEISRKHEFIDTWETLVSGETTSVVTSTLRTIEEQLPSKEFQKTAQERPDSKLGFATVSAQNSTQVRLAFRATFRSMQRALLELESRMPQLQLQELRIDPSPNSNSLNFQLTYTAWEK